MRQNLLGEKPGPTTEVTLQLAPFNEVTMQVTVTVAAFVQVFIVYIFLGAITAVIIADALAPDPEPAKKESMEEDSLRIAHLMTTFCHVFTKSRCILKDSG